MKEDDLRTIPRTRLWNEAAFRVMRKYDIDTLDAFDLTAPFILDSLDNNHFQNTPAGLAILQHVLHYMDI